METAIVIMAAGVGSRFGGGIKQLTPIGPSGEIIMDYSIYDALEAGFNKVVFILRRDLEAEFKEIIGDRISRICDVKYAFQEIDDLPEGFTVPQGRTKPWGTGQAVLSCKGLIDCPFLVINADDYYGKEAFVKMHEALVSGEKSEREFNFCAAGFVLENTLSDNGGVTRGVCMVNALGELLEIDETSNIVKTEQGAGVLNDDGSVKEIDHKTSVSMNMWGITLDFFDYLEERFIDFLEINKDEMKAEFLLPNIIDDMIQDEILTVMMIRTNDKWFGVTYKEDKETVKVEFAKLTAAGVYPQTGILNVI